MLSSILSESQQKYVVIPYSLELLPFDLNNFALSLHMKNRICSTTLRANSFLLCMCSPVLHKMLCGSFIESHEKKLKFQDVNGVAFGKALGLWCGMESCAGMELGEVKELASVADRFQMTDVSSAIDTTVLRNLSMIICGEVLSWSGELGLRKSDVASRILAAQRFSQLAKTEGFMQMDEEVIGKLLDDDNLAASNEETVWEAVAAWRAHCRRTEQGQARGRGLVARGG
jgi:hypothetical protein